MRVVGGEERDLYSRKAAREARRPVGRVNPEEAGHQQRFYSATLISGTRGVKNGVKGCPKQHLLHRVDHVTVSRFFLARAVKCQAGHN